jgi:hypothetical protein
LVREMYQTREIFRSIYQTTSSSKSVEREKVGKNSINN